MLCDGESWVSVFWACDVLGLPLELLHRAVRDGRLPCICSVGKFYVLESAARDLYDAYEEGLSYVTQG